MDQDVALLSAQGKALPDQRGSVGVDDPSLGVPDLDPYQRATYHVLPDHPVHGGHGRWSAGEEALGHRGLNHGLGQEVRGGGGVVDRLCLRQSARGHHPDQAHREQHHESTGDDLPVDPPGLHRRLVVGSPSGRRHLDPRRPEGLLVAHE